MPFSSPDRMKYQEIAGNYCCVFPVFLGVFLGTVGSLLVGLISSHESYMDDCTLVLEHEYHTELITSFLNG